MNDTVPMVSPSGLRWSDIKRQLTDWQHSIRSRSELEGLDDRCLQDIGIYPRHDEP